MHSFTTPATSGLDSNNGQGSLSRATRVCLIALVALSTLGLASGCRNNSQYGSCATRIPAPGTGSYTIPAGARSASEPYYTRPEGAAAASGTTTGATTNVAPASNVTPSSGQWQRATVPPSSSSTPAAANPLTTQLTTPSSPSSNSTALMWRSVGSSSAVTRDDAVEPASFTTPSSPAPGPASVVGLLPVSTTPVPPSAVVPAASAPAASQATTSQVIVSPSAASEPSEPNRLPETQQATLLPTEAGTIGSGVRSGSTSEVSAPSSTGRLSVDDMLGSSQATFRPRL